MPKNKVLSTEEQILSVLMAGSRSSEQLAKKLGITLYGVGKSCKWLKELRMVLHENDLWRIYYREGTSKKIVDSDNGTLSEVLVAYKRKARNNATVKGQKTYSGKRGSKAEWVAGVKVLVASGDEYRMYLEILGLGKIPSLKQLKEAWRNRMKTAHPDVGGATQDAILINEAYAKLRGLIGE